MLILEGLELNWVQYQINHGIEMGHDSNSVVWMTVELAFGILERIKIGFMFGCIETECSRDADVTVVLRAHKEG